MERAVAQARKCVGEPGKVTPKVGAVIVRDGRLLGEAYRGELKPGEHAEYTLLERKLKDAHLAGAVLYTTLEPCTTRTDPKMPCVERIIERRISQVYIGTLDPNDTITGQGELRLRDAGVRIARFSSDLMEALEEINREFSRQHRARPEMKQRTAAATIPVEPGTKGPNRKPIGDTKSGRFGPLSISKETDEEATTKRARVTIKRPEITPENDLGRALLFIAKHGRVDPPLLGMLAGHLQASGQKTQYLLDRLIGLGFAGRVADFQFSEGGAAFELTAKGRAWLAECDLL